MYILDMEEFPDEIISIKTILSHSDHRWQFQEQWVRKYFKENVFSVVVLTARGDDSRQNFPTADRNSTVTEMSRAFPVKSCEILWKSNCLKMLRLLYWKWVKILNIKVLENTVKTVWHFWHILTIVILSPNFNFTRLLKYLLPSIV